MLSKNNFANGYGFQFNYQETPFDLRQRDEGDLN